MFARKFLISCALLVCLASAVYAQALSETTIVPLTVDQGFPLQVTLTQNLRFRENEPVHAKLIEPVYAVDREVVPSGTEVIGRITGFQKAGKWKRISTLLGGDFTPVRQPQITFDTLVLPDGSRIPIDTSAVPGSEKTVRSDSDRIQSGNDLKNSFTSTVKEPKERLKNVLWGLAPYHPQFLPAGTHLNAELLAPLDFGEAVFVEGALDQLGSQPPAGSIASARLTTPLDSGTTRPGTAIEAILTRPLFSPDHRLIFPAGSMLHGDVRDVTAAKAWHRAGQLAFRFTTIEPPASFSSKTSAAKEVDGSLVGIQVGHDMKDLHLNEQGAARIAESKKRLIAPAIAFVKAGRSVTASSDDFETALLGAYRGKAIKAFTGSDPGFGLPGSISGAMIPPLGMGLSFFGAARSAYSNFIGRGRDIRLPVNTALEIRLENTIQ
jgi:hypothetical protein